MKKYTIIIHLLVVSVWFQSFGGLCAQVWKTNWQSISRFEKIKFLDPNIGYVSSSAHAPNIYQYPGKGIHSILLKTTNGGTDWTESAFDSSYRISSFDFLTPDFGMVSLRGNNNIKDLRITTNGGQSWFRTNSTQRLVFAKINIINQQLVYAIGFTEFYKSTNGGQSWTTKELRNNYDMQFVDADNGYIYSYDTIRKTTNGGQNWTNIAVKPTNLRNENRFHFNSPTHGYLLMDSGRVFRTTNGGSSWAKQSLGPNLFLMNISFSDPLNGYILGGRSVANEFSSVIFQTTDGGMSWQERNAGNLPHYYDQMSVVNASTVYVADRGLMISKTTDQTQSWTTLLGLKSRTEDIFFPSSRTGHLISTAEPDGTFFSTSTNSGKLWKTKKIREPDEPMLKAIWFTDSLTGYLAGAQGHILKTTNAGQNWQYQNADLPDTIMRLHFLSANNGFAIGGRKNTGLLLRTTNAGQNWLPQTLPVTNKKLHAISFVNANVGFIAGQDGLVLRTIDAGQSWSSLNLGFSSSLNGVWFSDPQNGFACGVAGSIFKTTDGGNTWTRRVLDQNAVFYDIKFLDNKWHVIGAKRTLQSGWIRLEAAIYISTNVGVGWLMPNTSIEDYYRSWSYTKLYIKSDKQAYLLTDFIGFFEHNAHITSAFKPIRSTSNLSELDFQMYPNPSLNGRFTIDYPFITKTKLTITTLQSKIMGVWILEKPHTNIGLPAGAYIVRLENSQGSSTRKLIVY